MTEKTDPLTLEQAQRAIGQRDALMLISVAQGLRERWELLLTEISHGQRRNTNWNKGYMQCLRDTEATLAALANSIAPPAEAEPVSDTTTEPEPEPEEEA